MKRLPLIVLASLALGGAALAAEQPGASSNAPGQQMKQGSDNKMQGPPNAAGFDKSKSGASDTTGSTGSGAASATSSDSKVKR